MQFSLLVLSAPGASQSPATALRFAKTLLAEGHSLYRVFFFYDGVLNGSALSITPQDESDIPASWRQLANDHGVDLVLCVSSALKKGILSQTEADRHDKPAMSVAESFDISGLGQLIDAALVSDRLIEFGG